MPVYTLHDGISRNVCHDDETRPKPLLLAVEEKEFEIFLVEVS